MCLCDLLRSGAILQAAATGSSAYARQVDTHNQQRDVHIPFYDEIRNAVHTRYMTSAFLGHATAAIMAYAFLDVCRGVDLNRMLQLLKYVMTRNLACLDPRMMASDSHGCVSTLKLSSRLAQVC